MKKHREAAKRYLEQASLDEYNKILENARLTNRQRYILDKKYSPEKKYSFQIGMEINLSPETIRDEIAAAYDKISKVLPVQYGRRKDDL